MEAICPISTRSVISNRFADPRLSVEPKDKTRCFVHLEKIPEAAVELTECSRIMKSLSVSNS